MEKEGPDKRVNPGASLGGRPSIYDMALSILEKLPHNKETDLFSCAPLFAMQYPVDVGATRKALCLISAASTGFLPHDGLQYQILKDHLTGNSSVETKKRIKAVLECTKEMLGGMWEGEAQGTASVSYQKRIDKNSIEKLCKVLDPQGSLAAADQALYAGSVLAAISKVAMCFLHTAPDPKHPPSLWIKVDYFPTEMRQIFGHRGNMGMAYIVRDKGISN